MKRVIKEWAFRKWYWYVSKTDKNAEVLFMNFGYQGEKEDVRLSEEDEKNRYSIQLYHKLASFTDLAGKNICEIGCGRGGGLSFIHKNFNPKSSKGLDLNHRAVKFCNEFYKSPELSFVQGDAQDLPFAENSFDVILNVESSHRYPSFNTFLSEAYRTLDTGGFLLLTDFRFANEYDSMQTDIARSGFEIVHQEIITSNVVKALAADDARKRELVNRLVPYLIRKVALNFAGAIDSDTYNKFKNGGYIYFIYVLKKVK